MLPVYPKYILPKFNDERLTASSREQEDSDTNFQQRFCRIFSSVKYVVVYGFTVNSYISEWKINYHIHFEADTLLLFSIQEIMYLKKDCRSRFFLHILTCWSFLWIIWLNICLGCKTLSVNKILEKLGEEKLKALLCSFVMTDCDHVENIYGINKHRSIKTYMQLTGHSWSVWTYSRLGRYRVDGDLIPETPAA